MKKSFLQRCRILGSAMSFFAIVLLSATSCQIGLGASVDTMPPEITFAESDADPLSNAVIRGAFVLRGDWSDDGKLKEIKITLSSNSVSSSAEIIGTIIEGEDKGSGSWQALINPDDLGLIDGTYDIRVSVKDNGGHISEITRSYILDNTAPVLILSRPSSTEITEDNKIESYGQHLTIEGQAADDNDVKSLVINFYSKEAPDTLLYTKTVSNIPPTISLDIATFLDESAYTAIYGNEKNGEKSYYCTITAYDSARRYPAGEEEYEDDALGNGENAYILWTDWEKALNDSGLSLKVPDLYHIKSGVYFSNAARKAEQETISNMWNSLLEKTVSLSSFKLNPENSPTYSVSGLNLGIITNVENDSSLTVQLAKGLDGISLNTESMRVYLQACDENGVALAGSQKLYPGESTYYQKGDGQFLTKITKNKCTNADGTAVNLEYGSLYIIGVEGSDVSGNTILPSFTGQKYLIKFKAKNIAPEVVIESPAETINYMQKGTSLKIKGTAAVPDGYPVLNIRCKKGAADSQVIYTHTFTDADKVSETEYLITYAFEFTVGTTSSSSYYFAQDTSSQYVFDIIATLDEMSTAYTKTVLYDVDGPSISIESMLPTASKYSDNEEIELPTGEYLNGNVTMKVSIIDDYDTVNTANTYWKIISSKSPEASAEKHYFKTPAKESFVIDTEEIAGTEEITVKIYAEDRAGNSKSYEKKYKVDQATDTPLIRPYTPKSVTLTYDSSNDITAALNNNNTKSVMTAGSPLQLKIIDDDGIKACTFLISNKDTGENLHQPENFDQTVNGSPVEYILSYSLPTITGRYKCSVEVEDIYGNKASKVFWIAVTSPAPVVTIASTTNKIITQASSNTITNAKKKIINEISIDSGYNDFKVVRQEEGCEPETLYGQTTETRLNAHTFTDEFVPSSSRTANKVTYTVTDENQHSGERVFEYYVDSTPPSIAQSTITVPTNTQTESLSFRFAAVADDDITRPNISAGDTKASGITKLKYTFDPNKADDNIREVLNVSSLSENILFSDYPDIFNTEGKKKIYICAYDDVGNYCDWVEKEFMYDKASPQVQITSYKRGSEAANPFAENVASKSFETGEAFTLSGTVSDGNGIQTFQIWQKKSGETYSDEKGILILSETNKTDENWSISGLPRKEDSVSTEQDDDSLESGTYIYTVRAIDKSAFTADSRNESAKTTDQTVTVKIDKTKPTISINLAEENTSESTAYGENSLSGNAYTFRGEAKDDPVHVDDFSSGFDTLYYAFTRTNSEPYHSATSPFANSVKPSTESWSFTMNLGTGATTQEELVRSTNTNTDTADTLYEGKKYLWVYGVDKAGNISETKSVAFMIDQKAPVINSLEVYKNNNSTTPVAARNGIIYITDSAAESYTLSGSASDANGISKVTIDGQNVEVSNGSWSKTFNTQGSFIHKVVVYDGSGKTAPEGKKTEQSIHVIFDKEAPSVGITGLDSSANTKSLWVSAAAGSDYYINGTAADTGSGLKEIKIKVDDSDQSDENDDNYETLPLSSKWSYKYVIPENFAQNDIADTSYHSVTVIVYDNAGNSSKQTSYFRYDNAKPLANLVFNKDGQFVNEAAFATEEGITLSGYAHDGRSASSGRAVKEAKILVSKDGTAQSAMTMNLITDENAGFVTTVGNTFGNFSERLAASDFTDGKYAFTLQVKDVAGNSPDSTSSLTASMVVDKTAPSAITCKFDELANGAALRSNKSKATLSVSFTEANPDAVYYYVNDKSDSSITQETAPAADWVSMNMSGSGTSWTATKDCSFNDGHGEVYIKVVDKAGNTAYGTPLSYEVDTKKPDVCTLVTVDDAVLVGSKLINGQNDVTFVLRASDYNDNNEVKADGSVGPVGDDPSKIAAVKLYRIGSGNNSAVTVSGNEIASSVGTEGNWTITIPKARFTSFTTGSYPVSVLVTDTFGLEKEFQLFTLDIDTGKPEIKSYSLENSYDAGLLGDEQTQTFFMNNQKNDFVLSGVAKDDREIDKVTLTLSGTYNGASKTESYYSTESAWSFELTNAEWKNWTGSVNASLTAVDKAKNEVESPVSFTIIFDNNAPEPVHLFDSNEKDLYFRVGEQDNEDPETLTDLDKKVGQQYSANTYGKDGTLKICGNFAEGESGSGLKMIYYKLCTSLYDATTFKTLFDSNPANAVQNTTGYFAPKSETKRVYYTDTTNSGTLGKLSSDSYHSAAAASSRYYTDITSDFITTISGFEEGKNFLVLIAEDNVGNLAIDNVGQGAATQAYYQINLDTKAPVISSLANDIYTNASQDLVLSFTVEDQIDLTDASCQPAGIKSVLVNMGGVTAEKEAALGDDGKWSVTIPVAELPNTSGYCSVSVTAIDAAGEGNTETKNIGNVVVDREFPTVDMKAISDADLTLDDVQVNGRITIEGTARDSYGLKEILGLCYKVSSSASDTISAPANQTSIPESGWTAPSGWTKVACELEESEVLTAWTFNNINTNILDGQNPITDGSIVWISAAVQDMAGNVKYSTPKKVIVDQNSDRPIIKFSNLSWDSSLADEAGGVKEYNKNLSTLTGTISDDDGISDFKIKLSSTEITAEPALDNMTDVEVTSGSFSINLGSDGQKYIWIYVKDINGVEFKTSAASSLAQPYLIFDNHKDSDGKDIRSNSTENLSFAINSTPPVISSSKYKAGASDSFADEQAQALSTTNYVGGSVKKYVGFSLELTSAVPIASVKASASGVPGDVAFSENENASSWDSPAINVMAEAWGEGVHTITFTVEDASGLTTVETKQITVDKTGPEVTLTSPGADDITGTIVLKGTSTDNYSEVDVEEVGFAILDNRYYSPLGTLKAGAENDVQAAAKASVASLVRVGSPKTWTYTLGANQNPTLPSSEAAVENAESGINLSPLSHVNNEDVRQVTIVFYAKDTLGNESYTPITSTSSADASPITINYNPFGDRPSSEISYPSGIYRGADTSDADAPNYVENYSNINGSIRVTGSARDNNSISEGKVFIQLDVNKDGLFNGADVTLLNGAGYTIINDITDSSAAIWAGKTLNASAVTYYNESVWGIAVSGTNSWSINLNSRDEFKLDEAAIGDGTKYKIGVRSVAVDNTGVFGKWSEAKYFMVDTNAPQITKSELVTAVDAEISQLYSDDMYLKGTQFLKLTVKDKEGIKKITYALADNMNSIGTPRVTHLIDGIGSLGDGSTSPADAQGSIVKRTGTENGYVFYNVFIPVSELTAAGKDSLALKVTAYKNADSELSTYERYSMSFDNQKPEIDSTIGITFNGVKGDATPGSMTNRLMNSNGQYFTLGGKIKDTGSGYDRIAFYYYRDKQNTTGQKRRVYDVDPSGSVGADNRTVQVTDDTSSASLMAGITKKELSSTEEAGVTAKTEPIYGYESAVTISSDGLTVTLAAENSHIRAGGLVEINGFWHLISAKNGLVLTLASATTSTSSTTAFFPIALVIDNLGAEKTSSNGNLITGESGDDGDAMPESVVKNGSFWTFDASIHSNYIPDGPGNLVVFIWDKAGNLEVQKFTASVQNNAPRLTKLWLGTDLTGSKQFSEEAFTEYDVLTKTGTAQSSYEMATASYTGKRFRIKGDLAVVGEFTGGNGTGDDRLKMVLNSSAESESSGYCADNGQTGDDANMYSRDASLSAKTWFTASAGVTSSGNFAFVIDKSKLGSDSAETNGSYANRAMSFTFWDKTEETTQGIDSCYSYLKLTDLMVMLQDNFPPTVAIDPFYWKSQNNNSLAGFSYKNGHIDLPSETGATFDLTTGMYKNGSTLVTGSASNKPKVSGKISLRGSALDGHGLQSIWVAFTNSTGTSVFTPAGIVAADTESAYYKIAKYNATTSEWDCASDDSWKCTILSDETTMEGQLVSWQLDIDTSKMSGGMGNDMFFKVMARDKSYTSVSAEKHQSSETASGAITRYGSYDLTNEGVNHPSYQVDVVPYISDVYDENDLPANRSRLGRFPVRAGQTIKIKGFNFGSGAAGETISLERWKTGATVAEETITASRTDVNTITLSAPAYSGYLRLKIGDTYAGNSYQPLATGAVQAPYNIEAGYLSSDSSTHGLTAANTAGSNFWTDDRYLSVWNVAEQSPFPGSINPHSGVIKKVSEQNSGSNWGGMTGNNYNAAPAAGGGYLYKQPESKSQVDGITGMNDSYFAAISSDDLKLYGYVSGNTYEAHGDNIAFNSSEVAYFAPVDEMDYTIVNGMPYYVYQDNSLGGSSGSVWGMGLSLAREGTFYNRNYFNTGAGNTIEEEKLPFFIERQGYNKASHTRDSSTGYDSVLYQFKNPRIAGWYDASDSLLYSSGDGGKYVNGVDLIYVSYYDSYAKCLKYAAFRSGHRVTSNAGQFATVGLDAWGKCDVSDNLDIVAEMTSSPRLRKWDDSGDVRESSNQPEQKKYNHMTDGASVVAGSDTTSNNPTASVVAGEWSDVFVDATITTDPRPVIIYYNKTEKSLEVAYGKTKFPEGTAGWTKSENIRPIGVTTDFGRYVSAAMDGAGNLHVAAQDADTSKLYYLYLTKTGETYSVTKSVAVDASNGAGRWTDIELTSPNATGAGKTLADIKPVISYIDTSFLGTTKGVKVAYVVDVDSAGSPIFEAMTDPARYAPNDQRTSVMADVKETKSANSKKATVGVGFNSDMLALDFLRDE